MAEPALRTIRLYSDEDADARFVQAIRQRHYDIQSAATAGMLQASDDEQLIYAISQQRTLVTHNIKHFPRLHAEWREAGREHFGIILLIGQPLVGVWLRRMDNLLARLTAKDLYNRLIFLGAEFD